MSEISDLFEKPPLDWTAADKEKAIKYFQEHRGLFHRIKPDGSLKRVRKPKAKEGQ